jgi:hypothetical protein
MRYFSKLCFSLATALNPKVLTIPNKYKDKFAREFSRFSLTFLLKFILGSQVTSLTFFCCKVNLLFELVVH